MLALLLMALLTTISTPPPIMAERRADHFASLAMLEPPPKYEVTSKTRFFIDNQEVTQKAFMDGAGLITELIVEGAKILTIKAKAK